MFDLDKSLASWRHYLKHNRAFSSADIDELEQHLRDEINARIATGEPEASAFTKAMQEMGDFASAETEYNKVFWGKTKQRRHLASELKWRLAMFGNYFKISFRTLRKQKGYAFINIFGLAIGLACFILILLFVQHEFSYDRFHENGEQTYRVLLQYPHQAQPSAITPAPLAHALATNYADVMQATTIDDFYDERALLSRGEAHYWEQGLWADAPFFQVFSFPLLQGDPRLALANPQSLVLTESLAEKIFGDEPPMGKTVTFQNQEIFTVTGIIADVPDNSSLQFTFVVSLLSQPYYVENLEANYLRGNLSWQTFLLLTETSSRESFEPKLSAFVLEHVAQAGTDPDRHVQYSLQPLQDIHLKSNATNEHAFTGSIAYVYLLLAIALIILLLACFNYMNLAISRSLKRAHEVGLRKVVGAIRSQLVAQFLGESVLMTFFALLLSIGFVYLTLPLFSHLVERPISMDFINNSLLLPGLLILVLIVGFLSGSYPAFFMASLQPKHILKGRPAQRVSRFPLQHALIVAQYTVSIALIACGLVVHQQLQFVQQTDIGYEKEHIVTIKINDEDLRPNYETIRNEWLSHPDILEVSYSGHLPTNINSSTDISEWEGSADEDRMAIYENRIHYGFLELFGMDLIAGRTFSQAITSDATLNCIINESAARKMGWSPSEALGKSFKHFDNRRTIIGVVKDFHMHSLHQAIEPLMMRIDQDYNNVDYIAAKIRPHDLQNTLGLMQQSLGQFSPYPFLYAFLDDSFDQLYEKEQRLGEIFGFFTVLALIIASLGLFGLAAYAAEQRTKEIGVRKVLGASAGSIVLMLSRDFARLVLISAICATPIAYFTMQNWLEGFSYHTDIGPGVFLITSILTLGLALATVSYQSIRAATANPVTSLSHE